MVTVDILYEIKNYGFDQKIDKITKTIETKYNIDLKINIVNYDELIDKLKTNPNYDFVILHLGYDKTNAFKKVDRFKKLTNSVLVADSTLYPYGHEEILEHFDEYIGFSEWNFKNLLKKYGFVNEKS